jgi:hypothetical protein
MLFTLGLLLVGCGIGPKSMTTPALRTVVSIHAAATDYLVSVEYPSSPTGPRPTAPGLERPSAHRRQSHGWPAFNLTCNRDGFRLADEHNLLFAGLRRQPRRVFYV